MAIRDVFKVSRKTFFNPTEWLGLKSIRSDSRNIISTIKDEFAIPEPTRKESFNEALQRLNVQEADLEITAKNYRLYAYVFLSLGLLILFFGFYLLFRHHTFSGLILSVATCALFLAQAFRFDFWYFQIKNRKLGCTFDEWWSGKLNNGDTAT